MGMPAWSFKDYFHLTWEIVAESILGSSWVWTSVHFSGRYVVPRLVHAAVLLPGVS